MVGERGERLLEALRRQKWVPPLPLYSLARSGANKSFIISRAVEKMAKNEANRSQKSQSAEGPRNRAKSLMMNELRTFSQETGLRREANRTQIVRKASLSTNINGINNMAPIGWEGANPRRTQAKPIKANRRHNWSREQFSFPLPHLVGQVVLEADTLIRLNRVSRKSVISLRTAKWSACGLGEVLWLKSTMVLAEISQATFGP